MRRIAAILLIALIAFLVAYGVFSTVKTTVDNFILRVAGPAVLGSLNNAYIMITSTVGPGGFAALMLGGGAIIGIIIHFLWVRADWRLRRWSTNRIRKDLGVAPVTTIPTTPPTATTRPTTPTVTQSTTAVTEEKEKAKGEKE